MIDRLISANAQKANPSTTATVASQATPSSLAAGLYYFIYSFVDAFGETLAGGRSTQFNLATPASNCPRVTLPALPSGVKFINLYVSPAGGASGSERLYATGITTTTFDCTYAVQTDLNQTLPAANTTGSGHPKSVFDTIGALNTQANDPLIFSGMTQLMAAILQGDPMQLRDGLINAYHYAGVMTFWKVAMDEIGTLLWANLPSATLANVARADGSVNLRKVMP